MAALVGTMIVPGCGIVQRPAFPHTEVSREIPMLHGSMAPGSALGQCVTFDTGKLPSVGDCGPGIDGLLKRARERARQEHVRRYHWGVFRLAAGTSDVIPVGAGVDIEVMDESVTSGATSLVGLFDGREDSQTIDSAFNACQHESFRNKAIVVKEFHGCSRFLNRADAKADVEVWQASIGTSAADTIGTPRGFRSGGMLPSSNDDAEQSASCLNSQVIRVAVKPARELCEELLVAKLEVASSNKYTLRPTTPRLECAMEHAQGHGWYSVADALIPEPSRSEYFVLTGGCTTGLGSGPDGHHNAILLESHPIKDGWHCKSGDQRGIKTDVTTTAHLVYCRFVTADATAAAP